MLLFQLHCKNAQEVRTLPCTWKHCSMDKEVEVFESKSERLVRGAKLTNFFQGSFLHFNPVVCFVIFLQHFKKLIIVDY